MTFGSAVRWLLRKAGKAFIVMAALAFPAFWLGWTPPVGWLVVSLSAMAGLVLSCVCYVVHSAWIDSMARHMDDLSVAEQWEITLYGGKD